MFPGGSGPGGRPCAMDQSPRSFTCASGAIPIIPAINREPESGEAGILPGLAFSLAAFLQGWRPSANDEPLNFFDERAGLIQG